FTQGPGGTLALQVTPSTAPGTFPTIHAGTIALGGALRVLPTGILANYVNGVTFKDVFSANTPITGSFASITTSIPLLTASVTPDTPDAFNVVLGLDRQALAASAQDLTQSLHFGIDASRTLIGTVQDRLVIGEDYDGGIALGDQSAVANGQLQKPERGGVWGRAYGVVGNASASGAAPSYQTNGAGFIAGADWKATPNWLIGVAANYAASSLDFADAGHTNVTTYQGALYTGWNSGAWYATGIAGFGVNAFGTTRQLAALGLPGSATSSPNGQTYSSYAETGYRFSQQGFAVTPYAGLGYIHAHINGFTESGGLGALSVNAGSSDSLATDLGVRLTTSVSIAGLNPIQPEVKLGWRHEFLDAAQTLTAALAGLPGSNFGVTGTNFGRESALVGVGATQALGSSARLFVAYDGQFSRKLNEHVFTAGFTASF
ncbi:MAG: autotransporter outer membrane beta-barrel domain-containing protein, partial [Hyphomicrobiales bacterium]|nr:autotransporter outer membrane beta-barrel domain-containing protein [Hyphomicrobiales bacterium]